MTDGYIDVDLYLHLFIQFARLLYLINRNKANYGYVTTGATESNMFKMQILLENENSERENPGRLTPIEAVIKKT